MYSQAYKFNKLLGYDVTGYFDRYSEFVSFYLPSIFSFYNRESAELSAESVKRLNELIEEKDYIYNKINANKTLLNNVLYFEFVTIFEDIVSKLSTWENLGKWLGSSVTFSTRNNNVKLPYTLSERETIERAGKLMGYENSDEGFLDLTRENNIKETDYTLSGGKKLYFNYSDSNLTVQLNTVVGPLRGDDVYSKDVDQNFVFSENDLSCLPKRETFIQTCNILLGLNKNDNPEFPDDGIDKTMLSDRKTAFACIPIVTRNMQNYISKDDTIKNFYLRDIKFEGDALRMNVEFYSQLDKNDFVLANYNA